MKTATNLTVIRRLREVIYFTLNSAVAIANAAKAAGKPHDGVLTQGIAQQRGITYAGEIARIVNDPANQIDAEWKPEAERLMALCQPKPAKTVTPAAEKPKAEATVTPKPAKAPKAPKPVKAPKTLKVAKAPKGMQQQAAAARSIGVAIDSGLTLLAKAS